MDLRATCEACKREFLLAQVTAQGACPWCGTTLAPNYTTMLSQAIRRASALGDAYVDALRQLAGLQGRFTLDADRFLTPVREALSSGRAQRDTADSAS